MSRRSHPARVQGLRDGETVSLNVTRPLYLTVPALGRIFGDDLAKGLSMKSNMSFALSRNHWIWTGILSSVGVLCWWYGHLPIVPIPVHLSVRPIRPPTAACPTVRSGLEQRLLLASESGEMAIAETPIDLGSLEPKGRINPDGSEVWGYPEGSGLEEVIEVHVKEGRVVREVLRPSAVSSASLVAGVLSQEDGQDAGNGSNGS